MVHTQLLAVCSSVVSCACPVLWISHALSGMSSTAQGQYNHAICDHHGSCLLCTSAFSPPAALPRLLRHSTASPLDLSDLQSSGSTALNIQQLESGDVLVDITPPTRITQVALTLTSHSWLAGLPLCLYSVCGLLCFAIVIAAGIKWYLLANNMVQCPWRAVRTL